MTIEASFSLFRLRLNSEAMSLFAGRLLHLPSIPSVRVETLELSTALISPLPRYLSTPPFQFVSSTRCLLSTTATQAPPPKPQFTAVDYLIQSCGLSSDEALKASKRIQHLKSPHKPDSVLRFLRDVGVSESPIATAVSRNSGILTSSVEKNLRPNVAKLQEIGLSMDDISGIISKSPSIFRSNNVSKFDFWMGVLGSNKDLRVVLESNRGLLVTSSLENVLIPNWSFLKEQCGLSPSQILRLIKSNSRLIVSKPEFVEKLAERAGELGIDRSSRSFVQALILVSYLNQSTINARLNNLRNLGLSQEEVTRIVTRIPLVLGHTEELMSRKIEFLLNEFGGDKLQLLHNPSLLTYSLDTRIIPRNLVRKLLKSKGIAEGNLALTSFMRSSEEKFLVKFIVPYEDAIPGLRQAYLESIARGTAA